MMRYCHYGLFYIIALARARIRPRDDHLTVFPDSCPDADANYNPRISGNCGIRRLDQIAHSWSLHSDDGVYTNIPATVPGDVITDLEDAGIISNPYYNMNFLDQRDVWMGEDRVKSHGTKCYSSYRDKVADEYKIPNLERRTRKWIYETKFKLPSDIEVLLRSSERRTEDSVKNNFDQTQTNYALVVEGIKMGASLSINGIEVGNTTDQFLRYIFPLSRSMFHSDLKISNTLSINFDPDIDTHGRFSACSGGWDWAPYSMTAEASCSSRRTFSFGIFKPIYMVKMRSVAIMNVVPKIRYLGDSTVRNLTDGKDFEVIVDVHLLCNDDTDARVLQESDTAQVLLRAPFMLDITIKLKDADGRTSIEEPNTLIISVRTQVSREEINLWWPNGLGNQPLYTLEVAFRDKWYGTLTSWVQRQIGFRSIALITHKEDEVHISDEGTGNHGMIFKINGVPLYARGANVVPTSQLEGKLSDEQHQMLVESAAVANMNMLRVWGGGMIMPDSFYKACNERGILLYHDLMFVEEQYHGLQQRDEVKEEIRYITRQLSSHPSIVIWNGCNECDHTNVTSDLYSHFAMAIVAEEDPTRPVWSSSPSNGFRKGIHSKDHLPNGNKLEPKGYNVSNILNIEVHGPYNHGFSENFETVNGHREKGYQYDTKIPLKLFHNRIGVSYQNQFISEFGISTTSSFESMHVLLSEDNWGLHGSQEQHSNCTVIYESLNECSGSNVAAQRNYPCDSHIKAYFGDIDLNTTGQLAFQVQLLQCLLSQTLWIKGEIELIRSTNSYGSLIWQLNEHWPTGGWGLIEYSQKHDDGKITGGRWKPAMHLIKQCLFRDVFATCGTDIGSESGKCYIRNDGKDVMFVTLQIERWELTGAIKMMLTKDFELHPHGHIEYFDVDIDQKSSASNILVLTILDKNTTAIIMDQNIVLWKTPKELHGLRKDPNIRVLSSTPLSNGTVDILLSTTHIALYIGLTSTVQGRFEENWFSMKAGSTKTIKFFPQSIDSSTPFNITSFDDALRVEHLGMALE